LQSGISTFITTLTATGLTFGTTYTFVVQSVNSFGISAYSTELPLLCAWKPAQIATPTTVNLNSAVVVTWVAPSPRGLPITSYSVYFRKSDLTFALLTSSCDGSNPIILANTECTVPLDTLRAAPFNLVQGNTVIV